MGEETQILGNSSLKKIYHLFGRICLELSAHAARVNLPITDFLPMTPNFGRSFSILLRSE
jgi:hypothetical protein